MYNRYNIGLNYPNFLVGYSEDLLVERNTLVKKAREIFQGFVQSDFKDPDEGDPLHSVWINLDEGTAEKVLYLMPLYNALEYDKVQAKDMTLEKYIKRLVLAMGEFGGDAKLVTGYFGSSKSFRMWVPMTMEQLDVVQAYRAWDDKMAKERNDLYAKENLNRLHHQANALGYDLVKKNEV